MRFFYLYLFFYFSILLLLFSLVGANEESDCDESAQSEKNIRNNIDRENFLIRTKMRENLQKFEVQQVIRNKKQNVMLANMADFALKKKQQKELDFEILLDQAKNENLDFNLNFKNKNVSENKKVLNNEKNDKNKIENNIKIIMKIILKVIMVIIIIIIMMIIMIMTVLQNIIMTSISMMNLITKKKIFKKIGIYQIYRIYHPTKMKITEIRITEIRITEIRITEIRITEIRITEMENHKLMMI